MKHIIPFIAIVILFCSCGQEASVDPLYAAIEAEAMHSVADPYKFKIVSVEKVDSTVFATELERRMNVYQLKNQQNTKLYKRYMAQGLAANAANKIETIRKDNRILEALGVIHDRMQANDSLNVICYYDYKVTAKVSVKGKSIPFNDVYFSITPDNRVLTMSYEQKKLHKATGLVIPGYREVIDGELVLELKEE